MANMIVSKELSPIAVTLQYLYNVIDYFTMKHKVQPKVHMCFQHDSQNFQYFSVLHFITFPSRFAKNVISQNDRQTSFDNLLKIIEYTMKQQLLNNFIMVRPFNEVFYFISYFNYISLSHCLTIIRRFCLIPRGQLPNFLFSTNAFFVLERAE